MNNLEFYMFQEIMQTLLLLMLDKMSKQLLQDTKKNNE